MSAQAVIDSLEYARAGQELRGSLPVSGLTRLQDFLYDNVGSVEFVVKGGCDDEMRPVLSLSISGRLHLQCQRCLERLDYPLQLSNTLLLVDRVENLAETAVDPDAPDCVEASPALDVAGLIEDEILLGLPFAPRHEAGVCGYRTRGAAQDADQTSGLSKLAELKKDWKSKR
jgi:uncharacterized protein